MIELILILFFVGGTTQSVPYAELIDSRVWLGSFQNCADNGVNEIGQWYGGGVVVGFTCQGKPEK